MENQKEKMRLIIEELLKSRIKTSADLDCFKRKIAKKYQVKCLKSADLLEALRAYYQSYHKLSKNKNSDIQYQSFEKLEKLLRTRPVRSLSGIVNVSVLSKPYACPGKCLFCPSEKGLPKSYLKKEPAVQRAILCKFQPYQQVWGRLEALWAIGHPIDKIELRVIGGTWSYYPKKYQTWFVAECFRAANEFNKKSKGKSQKAKVKVKSEKLEKLQKANEKAKCRIIGISIETRPDYIDIAEIKLLRKLGVTRVELGVQTIYNEILQTNQRGHNVEAIIQATRLLKNAGFKVSYQMMPGLFGSNFKKDVAMFKELFNNANFKPDLLKIYPLALLKEANLYKLYQQGKYKPYNQKQLIKLLVEIKKQIPYWCRVERVVRDIPSSQVVEGGAKTSNLRQIVQKTLKEQNSQCKCIRCREVAGGYNPKEKIYLFRQDYQASGGCEIFLSYENKERTRLFALLRLRLSVRHVSDTSLTPRTAFIRELHTYGQMAEIAETRSLQKLAQHRGLGKKLIKETEKIVKQAGLKKIAVISGVGARPYWRKQGYRLQNTYMVKNLSLKK